MHRNIQSPRAANAHRQALVKGIVGCNCRQQQIMARQKTSVADGVAMNVVN